MCMSFESIGLVFSQILDIYVHMIPMMIGMARGRKISGSRSSRARLAAAIAASSVPTAAMPRSARTTPRIMLPSTGAKKSAYW